MAHLRLVDQQWLWEELERALARQQPLPAALLELGESHRHTRRAAVVRRLHNLLSAGHSFSSAVRAMGGAFSAGAAAAIEAGERSGNLAESLRALSEEALARSTFRFGIAQAITYPVIIGIAALGVTAVLQYVIAPQFMQMFFELNIELPSVTKVIIPILQIEALFALLIPAGILIILHLLPSSMLPGRRLRDRARLMCPLVGAALRNACLARWCVTMGALVRSQVPEAQAVRLSGDGSGNAHVAWLSETVAKRLDAGEPLADAMDSHGAVAKFFPPPLTWMVRASERAGGHSHVWPVAGDLYRELAERSGYIGSMLLRVFFVLLMIQIVTVTLLALFLPLAKLASSLGG